MIDYVHETAINLPGYQEYCQHQHEIRHRCAERARNADGYWVPYCGYPQRTCTYAELFNHNQTDEPTANNIVPINCNQERQEQAR